LVDHLQAGVIGVHACITCNIRKPEKKRPFIDFGARRETAFYDSLFGIMVNRSSGVCLLGYAYPKIRLEPLKKAIITNDSLQTDYPMIGL
jgi:hypothetical protein